MKARELVAWNLRRLRVAQGLAQELLAVDAGVDRTFISKVERGLANPTVTILEQLADALGVSIVEFFATLKGGSGRPKKLPSGRRSASKRMGRR